MERELAPCDADEGRSCPYSAECHERFALAGVPAMLAPLRDGEVDESEIHAVFGECPRRHVGALYRIDQGHGSIAELLRWRLSCGVHRRRRLTVGGSYLLREYERIRDLPDRLAEREAVHKPGGGAGGGAADDEEA